jgi:hypothetical protein
MGTLKPDPTSSISRRRLFSANIFGRIHLETCMFIAEYGHSPSSIFIAGATYTELKASLEYHTEGYNPSRDRFMGMNVYVTTDNEGFILAGREQQGSLEREGP